MWFVLLIHQLIGQYSSLPLVERAVVGNFQYASRLMLDFRKHLYVIDQLQHTLYYYPSVSEEPLTVGGFGWQESAFDTPTDVVTDGITVYVTDYGNHRVQFFDQRLRYIGSWRGHDVQRGEHPKFGFPRGIALGTTGEIFILDGEAIRVVHFSRTGDILRVFGDRRMKDGVLSRPLRIVVYQQNVYILESDKVYQYDFYGTFLRRIGNGVLQDARGLCVVKNVIWIVTRDTLYTFSNTGDLLTVTPLSYIFTSQQLLDVQDIATDGETVYLLTKHNIHILELRTN